jgi:hypothetical protein
MVMEKQQLTVPYKGNEYDVYLAIEKKPTEKKPALRRICAQVGGQDILFVANDHVCSHAIYRESIIDEGLLAEISKRICTEYL